MRNYLIWAIVAIVFSSGCLTADKTKNKEKKNIETYRVDLDGDGTEELVEIEDRYIKSGDTFMRITKVQKNRNVVAKEYSLTIPGHFIRAEIIDLDTDNFKQMAIFYDTKDSRINIAIYKLKNNKLSKVFTTSSNCDIETDMELVPRIKVAKSKTGGRDCSASLQGSDWETWAWSGEKFIKEH